MRDIPSIAASTYASTVMPLSAMGLMSESGNEAVMPFKMFTGDLIRRANSKIQENTMAANTRRLVKVVIVDPNDNIPLDKCLLYSGEEKLTDATDQELFFEIDIKDLLAKHNEVRVKLVDKKVKERTEYLEPAKIRDLKMVVVNIATF